MDEKGAGSWMGAEWMGGVMWVGHMRTQGMDEQTFVSSGRTGEGH